jgi:hypothetical protein
MMKVSFSPPAVCTARVPYLWTAIFDGYLHIAICVFLPRQSFQCCIDV